MSSLTRIRFAAILLAGALTSSACSSAPSSSSSTAPRHPTCGVEADIDEPCSADNPAACERSCNCNAFDDCGLLGLMYELGPTPSLTRRWERDPSRAFELYARACEGGSAGGCVNLGNAFERGKIVTKSVERARLAFSQACDAAHSRGCMRMGLLELRLERQRGLAGLRRSCVLLDAEGCWVLAMTLLESGLPAEKVEARTALTTGCRSASCASSNPFVLGRCTNFAAQACAKLDEL